MKAYVISLLILGMASLGTAAQSEVVDKKEKVQEQQTADQVSVDDAVEALLKDIEATFGFDVDCGGWFSDVNLNQCYLGLQSLRKALESVNPNIEREKLHDVEIVISPKGEWEGGTLGDPVIRIPYRAKPDRMAQYIDGQVHVLLLNSPEEVEARNIELEKQIKENYLFGVERSPDIRYEEYLQGLTKVGFVLAGLYDDAKSPTEDQKMRFGFDTVVLSDNNRNLYENKGELRVDVDYEDSIGDTAMRLIRQIQRPNKGWMAAQYTWEDVQQFRLTKGHIEKMKQDINQVLPNLKITCLLDNAEADSLNVEQCAKAVSNVQKAVLSLPDAASQIKAKKVSIIDTPFDYHRVIAEGLHVIGENMSADDILEALVSK